MTLIRLTTAGLSGKQRQTATCTGQGNANAQVSQEFVCLCKCTLLVRRPWLALRELQESEQCHPVLIPDTI